MNQAVPQLAALDDVPMLEPRMSGSHADALLQRIGVSPAHSALRGLCSPQPGTALAWTAPEQPLGTEAGPIAVAEAARHLGALGSIALASQTLDGGPRHYAVRAAHFERVCGSLPQRAQALVGEAAAGGRWDGVPSTVVCTVLRTPSGVTTHLMQIDYDVLDAHQLERTVHARQLPSALHDRDRHAEPVLLAMRALDVRHARAEVSFGLEQCAGHFDGFGAVPFGLLVQGLVSLAGRLYQHRAEDRCAAFAIQRADARFPKLAQPGEELLLHAEHMRDRGEETAIRCRATLADGGTVCELDMWLGRGNQTD